MTWYAVTPVKNGITLGASTLNLYRIVKNRGFVVHVAKLLQLLLRFDINIASMQTRYIAIESYEVYQISIAGVIGMSDSPFQWPPSHSTLGLSDSRSFYPRAQWLPVILP